MKRKIICFLNLLEYATLSDLKDKQQLDNDELCQAYFHRHFLFDVLCRYNDTIHTCLGDGK